MSKYQPTGKDGKWRREDIEFILENDDKAVVRAVVKIFQFQTKEEQVVEATNRHNGVGFRSCDAKFLSSLAKRALRTGELTPRMLQYARPLMRRYGRQLTDVANGKQVL